MSVVNLCEYLERSASRDPGRAAVVDCDGRVITFRELDEQANGIAGFLHANGIQKGDRVALVLPKSLWPSPRSSGS